MHAHAWTPGPWTFDYPENDRCNVQVWSSPDQRICFLAHDDTRQNETGIANGALIAAAPELYDALQRMVNAWAPEPPGTDYDAWMEAKAALARARGETD